MRRLLISVCLLFFIIKFNGASVPVRTFMEFSEFPSNNTGINVKDTLVNMIPVLSPDYNLYFGDGIELDFPEEMNANYFWSGLGESSWFIPGNWNLNNVPGISDNAYIDNGNTAVVENDIVEIGRLVAGYNQSGNILLGNTGEIRSQDYSIIAYSTGSSGKVTVKDGGRWEGINYFHVGRNGNGELEITGNSSTVINTEGRVGSAATSQSMAVVRDSASWINNGPLYVGNQGRGSLTVENALVRNQNGYLGNYITGYGEANITAGGRWVNNGILRVGNSGNGILTVSGYHDANQSIVSNTSGYVGTMSGVTGNVELIDGGQWNSTANVYMGYRGTGNLAVSGSGSEFITNAEVRLGDDTSAFGNIIISDHGKWGGSGPAYIGNNGSGKLEIKDSALVNGSFAVIGNAATADGEVKVNSGGRWINSGVLYVGGRGSGNLSIMDGGYVENQRAVIGNSTGSGEVVVDSGKWYSSGQLHVGNFGHGKLDIVNSGEIIIDSNVYVGNRENSTGELNISGHGKWISNGEQWVIGNLSYGRVRLNPTAMAVHSGGLFVSNYANGDGMLQVDSATIETGLVQIGGNTGSNGTVTVENGSRWINNGYFYVGNAGTGSLSVKSRSNVSSGLCYIGNGGSSSGTMLIENSRWVNSGILRVGNNGNGYLTLDSNAYLENTDATISNEAGSYGEVVMNGGEWFSSGSLYVGNRGTGSLTLKEGALLTNNGNLNIATQTGSANSHVEMQTGSRWISHGENFIIGNIDTGTLTLDSTSRIEHDNRLYVGNSNLGNLLINGGYVQSGSGIIGNYPGSDGNVRITAGGNWSNSGELCIGHSGKGTLVIDSNTRADGGNIIIGHNAGSEGIVWLRAGSLLQAVNRIAIGRNTGSGLLYGNGTAQSPVTVTESGAIISPGDTAGEIGRIDLIGNLYLDGGKFNVDIMGSDNDQIYVDGAISYGSGMNQVVVSVYPLDDGTWDIYFSNQTLPGPYGKFEVLYSDGSPVPDAYVRIKPGSNDTILQIFKGNCPAPDFDIFTDCPLDTLVTLPYGYCDQKIALQAPSITWIGGDFTFNDNLPVDSVYPAGIHYIEWTVESNHCGIQDTCGLWVVVNYSPCGTNDTIWELRPGNDPDFHLETVYATDYEQNDYSTVRINCECWTKENLRSTIYQQDASPVNNPMIYQAVMYPDTVYNKLKYGLLYDWNAATRSGEMDPAGYVQGICPDGWRLPTVSDYEGLISLGTDALRQPGEWLDDNTADNSSGFSALPAGYYNASADIFYQLKGDTYFWTSFSGNSVMGKVAHIRYLCPVILIEDMLKNNGASVRCIKNASI